MQREKRQETARWPRVLRRVILVLLALLLVLALACAGLIVCGNVRLSKRQSAFTPPQLTAEGFAMQADGSVQYAGTRFVPQENLFTVLCLGIDKSAQRVENGYENGMGLADTVILAALNLDTGAVALISIPRDSMVQLSAYDEASGSFERSQLDSQLALQYQYGGTTTAQCTQTVKDTVSGLLCGVSIDACVTLDMDAFTALTDQLGGMPVVIPDDAYYCAYTGYTPGQWVLLDSAQAMAFVQYRDVDVFASCEMRIERQKIYLNAMLDALRRNVVKTPWHLPRLYRTVTRYLYTDLSLPEMAALAIPCRKVSISDIAMYTAPGRVQQGLFFEEYLLNDAGLQQMLLAVFYTQA